MHITTDREICIGSGLCVLAAPDVFDQDDEDGRVLLLAETPKAPTPAVRLAVQGCPARALTLDDTTQG